MIPLNHMEILADLLYALSNCETLPRGYQIRCELRAPGATTGHRTVAKATLTDDGSYRAANGDRSENRSITIATY